MAKNRWSGRQTETESLAGPTAMDALPVYTVEQISSYLIKGFWKDTNGSGSRWWADTSITYDLSALSAGRQALAKMAFAAWDEICGLDFIDATGSGTAQISFAMHAAQPSGEATSWEVNNAFMTGGEITSSIIYIAENFYSSTEINSNAYEAFIHEIGHALGLGHAGDYNGNEGDGAFYQNDTRQFSIMSYVVQANYGGASSLNVLSPQLADIFAMTKKYGIDQIRETDTVYGNNASGLTDATDYIYNFDASGFDFNTFGPAFTIVDTGGIDTLDFSKYWAEGTGDADDGMRIDLRAGKFSDLGQWEGNIGIALGTVIENAFGGLDQDDITGNGVGNALHGGTGDDTLRGLGGNDFLTGGADADTFVYGLKGKIDHITDFENDVDSIDLGSMDFARFAKVYKMARDVGDDMLIKFSKDDKLILDDFSKADFDSTDVLI